MIWVGWCARAAWWPLWLRFWTRQLSDPQAAGIHQHGRLEAGRTVRWHGSACLITGMRSPRDLATERAWLVLW